MIKTVEVKTVREDWYCDSCDRGLMKPTGRTLLSYPKQHQHKCELCGLLANSFNYYPVIRYEDIPA